MSTFDTSKPTIALWGGIAALIIVLVLGVVAVYAPPLCEFPGLETHDEGSTPDPEFETEYRSGPGEFTITVQRVEHTRCNAFTERNTKRLEIVVESSESPNEQYQVPLPFGEGDSFDVTISPNSTVKVLWYAPVEEDRWLVLDTFEVSLPPSLGDYDRRLLTPEQSP